MRGRRGARDTTPTTCRGAATSTAGSRSSASSSPRRSTPRPGSPARSATPTSRPARSTSMVDARRHRRRADRRSRSTRSTGWPRSSSSSEARRKQGIELLERGVRGRAALEPGRPRNLAARRRRPAATTRILALYERVARNGGDWELLLDFLERRARAPTPRRPQIREAVDLAASSATTSAPRRCSSARSTSRARDRRRPRDARRGPSLALAERRLRRERRRAARATWSTRSPRSPIGRAAVAALGRDAHRRPRALAHRRQPDARRPSIYEFLREREPGRPRGLGAADRALPRARRRRPAGQRRRRRPCRTWSSPPSATRCACEHAQLPDREPPAPPRRARRAARRAARRPRQPRGRRRSTRSTLRALGDDEGLAEFLWQRFEDAQRPRPPRLDRRRRPSGSATCSSSWARPTRPAVYRAGAGESRPTTASILRRVVAHRSTSTTTRARRALLMERLLAVETGAERAPELAGRLATMWEAAGDASRRAAHARARAPRRARRRSASTTGSRPGTASTSSGRRWPS